MKRKKLYVGGGFFGDIKEAFNKNNWKGTAGNIATSVAGDMAYGLISDGYESGAGKAMHGIASAVKGVPGLGEISAGLETVGGIFNRIGGTKTNQEALRRVNAGINYYNNFKSNAATFDEVQPLETFSFENPYSGRGAGKKNATLYNQFKNAQQQALRGVDNNIDNLVGDQMSDALASYAAYGGPLGFGTGALGLMQQNRYFDSIDKRSDAIMRNNNMGLGTFVGKPQNIDYAFGGELGTNGTDFTNGLLEINEGGTHESNPLEGVPMGVDAEGTPNLVEEGETVYNDYVFSNRMTVPEEMYKELGLSGSSKGTKSKDITFADASKKLAEESEQRPNDPISQDGLEVSLSKLAAVQEAERMKNQMEDYAESLEEYACGGKMKYGLGGNLFGKGGKRYAGNEKLAAKYLRNKYPNASDAEIESYAKMMADYAYDHNYGYVGYQGVDLPRHAVTNREWEEIASKTIGLKGKENIGTKIGDILNGKEHKSGLSRAAEIARGLKGLVGNENKENKAKASETAAKETAVATGEENNSGYSENSGYSGGKSRGSRGRLYSYDNTGDVLGDEQVGLEGDNAGTRAAVVQQQTGQSEVPPLLARPEEGVERNWLERYAQEWNKPEYQETEANMTQQQTGQDDNVKTYPTWMRYAPVVGAGIMSLTDALGLTNRPDYTYANKLEAMAQRAGYAPNIKAEPIGDYLRYTPFDRLFYANQLQANARATDRALVNTSSPSKAAGLVANGYNTTNALGNLYRQAEEYNLAQRQQVADFNRKTNMFNSQMGLEADMANAKYRQAASQMGLSGLAQAAALRDTIDQRMGAAKALNLNNLLTSLGNIGRENYIMNQINHDDAYRWGVDSRGRSPWKGETKPSANGGKLRKRKK